jgi:hypothetical protein
MKNISSPAEGERRAMVGYQAQYQVAAELIYNQLLDGKLDWIKITDPEAGQVDDILIASPGQLDAYQVKWGEFVRNISFNDLISKERSKKGKTKSSLIRQMADGWKRLTKLYTDRQVIVHLIHRDIPSLKAKIPLDDPPPLKPNFQEFLKDCWYDKEWAEDGIEAIPRGWKSAMTFIKAAANIDDTEFLSFVKCCHLRFQYQLPQDLYPIGHDDKRRVQDIEQIFTLLIKMAGGEKRIIQVSSKELLRQLGWEKRFEFRSPHDFWVDEKLYQPISATINELESSLVRFNRGYLALIGTPGSGKSTTLTQTFRYRKGYRIIRYYAFIPDDTRLGRGESLNFLHDIVLALEQQGVRGTGRNRPESRKELLDKLRTQLAELGERWHKENVRTLILVDGLDHIEREQSPERTLLKDLPPPDAIPEGVLFILGSQKIDLLGLLPGIQPHLQEEGRTINMHPLDRQAVFAVIENTPLKVEIKHSQKEKILNLSEGNPLALNYLLQRLQNASDNNQVDAILKVSNPYRGHIENDYGIYWKSLEEDHEIMRLLAYISRLRGVINLREVVNWTGEQVVVRFRKQAGHLFRKENKYRWYFFHNSFRQFILSKTGSDLFGDSDETKHINYHRELADYASLAKPGTSWAWEELYHRACARDTKIVIQIGIQNYFRKQFYDLRPLEDIKDDISLLLKAAQAEQDGLAIIRSFLIEKELNARNKNIQEVDMPYLLLEISGIEAAVGYVIRDRKLRLPKTRALEFCDLLISRGIYTESKKIFDAAEPLELLSGSVGVNTTQVGNIDEITAWAKVAHHFRPFEKIFQAVEQLRPDASDSTLKGDPEKISQNIRYYVLKHLADGVSKSRDKEKIWELRDLLLQRSDTKEVVINLDFGICHENWDKEEARSALERILNWAGGNHIYNSEKILIAEFIFRLKNNPSEASRWLAGLPQPPHYKSETYGYDAKNLSPFVDRIRLNRLLSALGKQADAIKAVPDAEDEWQGVILFERMLVIISNIWGLAWRKENITPSEIIRDLYPAITLFNRKWESNRGSYLWEGLRQVAGNYFTFMINAVAAHGREALVELAEAFESQWTNENTRQFWSTGWRRHISLGFFHNEGSKETLSKRLDSIEKEMSARDDIHQRVLDCAGQALAWLEAGKPERARLLIPRMLETSFGIQQEKDGQFVMGVEWLGRINVEDIEGIENRIRRFAGTLVVLESVKRGSHNQEAARGLMETTALWNPGYAIFLRKWLTDKRALYSTMALEGLIVAALKKPKPPVEIIYCLTRHLLIPLQYSCNRELAKLLAASCLESYKENKARSLLESLVRTIETKTYPSEHRNWLRGLIDGCRHTDFDTSWLESKLRLAPKRSDWKTYPYVTLKSGESLNQEDAIFRINSYKDMLELIGSIEEVDRFQWEEALSKILEKLTLNQIKELEIKLKKFELSPIVSALFARRIAKLGYLDVARKKAEEVLKISSNSGWMKRFDGGTRLEAVRSIIAVDTSDSRKRAYKLLIDDYLAEIREPGLMVSSLDDLLSILFENPPIREIWCELEQHIYQLFDFSSSNEIPPSLDEVPHDISYADMLIQFLIDTFSIPVFKIMNEAHKALYELIADQSADSILKEKLTKLLPGSEEMQIQLLAIFELAYKVRPGFVNHFAHEISCLCISPNFIVRHLAKGIAGLLNIEQPGIDKSRTQLPLTYRMELPEFPMPHHKIYSEVLPPGQPFPDSSDPLEIIRPYQPSFEILSELTGIPLQNLVTRAVALMNSLSPHEKWNKQAEKDLRYFLISADMNMSLIRPRAALAHRAYGHVLAELFDARIINDNDLKTIRQDIISHDPALSLIEPGQRPGEIVIFREDKAILYSIKDWVNSLNEVFPLLRDRMDDGRVILGQLSRITRLFSETPTEYRLSMVCYPDWLDPIDIQEPYDFFPNSPGWYGFDYPNLEDVSQWYSTVIYAKPVKIELGGNEWLAVNPTIPRRLRWKHSPEGLFRWVDSKGNIMVESIMWQEGPIYRQPLIGEVYSEGWLVVASPEAAKLISKAVGTAIRFDAVVRLYRDGDEIGGIWNFAVNRKKHKDFAAVKTKTNK